jgi:hypothetical protein
MKTKVKRKWKIKDKTNAKLGGGDNRGKKYSTYLSISQEGGKLSFSECRTGIRCSHHYIDL